MTSRYFVWSRSHSLSKQQTLGVEPVYLQRCQHEPLSDDAAKILGGELPSDERIAVVLQFMDREGKCHSDSEIQTISKRRVCHPIDEADDASLQADLIHTYSVCALVMDLMAPTVTESSYFERVCGLGQHHKTQRNGKWLWGWQRQRLAEDGGTWFAFQTITADPSPLRLVAHGEQNKAGAAYFRSLRALLFYVQERRPSTVAGIKEDQRKTYSCRSMDVVAHEMGHAVLDAILPDWYQYQQPPAIPTTAGGIKSSGFRSDAFHEAFADATWVFVSMSTLRWCEEELAVCRGDLTRRCRSNGVGFTDDSRAWGEDAATHGSDENEAEGNEAIDMGCRTFTTEITAWSCGRGPYSIAMVCCSFIWDIVVHWFALVVSNVVPSSSKKASEGPAGVTPAMALWFVNRLLCDVWVRSTCELGLQQSQEGPSGALGASPFDAVAAIMCSSEIIRASISAVRSRLSSQTHSNEWPSPLQLGVCFDALPDATDLVVIIKELSERRGVSCLGIPRPLQRRSMMGNF